ncbi:Protein-tyrosine phosphatase-like,Tyrosine specific protein phosphatases domain,PH domain- [Cinara cedri]|uniref:phosphatidylinositol-3,5-bisphosphate 3-phosphatase n=1 Tax=Cinara cedri TaxID=506608 RepID=A0A5E4LYF2_9HEMI|nr:Protein-tyrosine phosphatase-like,Tyrosine specific protein phosphatases domain,PH domain- [Cinara cedri]
MAEKDRFVSPAGFRLYRLSSVPGSYSLFCRFRSWLQREAAMARVARQQQQDSSVIKKIENVRMLDRYNPKKTSVGTLYLTATHLIFFDTENNKESWVLLMHIGNVEKLPLTTTGSPILIRCKTFLSVTFVIPKERDSHNIFTSLLVLCQPDKIEDLYCFLYKSNSDKLSKSAGWDNFNLEKEYKRMNVPNEFWSLTTLNQDYQLCDTYPKFLFVPSSVNTSILVGSSKFRSKERLPVLTYLHSNKASICRCAQPLSGFNARCMEDEQLLTCVLYTNPGSEYMYVVDTRPKINAMANRATGKGYENENFYDSIKFHFLGIENIHVMRSSLSKVVDLCEQRSLSMSQFIGGLDNSGWLRHIKTILDTSAFICQAVNGGKSVVVHCSDGWDRTAQVCSLSSLMLDPYYRTLQGFQALIEKDWLAFGHKFNDRCGHIAGDSKEISPVFTQFVEATWQLTMIQPTTFEFNERFLLVLHDHVTSCQYGTFIGNCEKERGDLKLKDRTFSFWGYVDEHKKEFLNPLFSARAETIIPDLSPQNIRFWRGMYCRFENGVHPREHVYDILLATSEQTKSLDDHVKFLQKRLSYFKRKITDGADMVKNSLFSKETCIESMSYNKEDNIIQSMNETFDNLTIMEPKLDEAHKVAIEWKSLREVVSCECSTDSSTKKYHCWKCGNVFCTRCIDMNVSLPGHLSQNPVPVCHGCRKIVSRSSTESS